MLHEFFKLDLQVDKKKSYFEKSALSSPSKSRLSARNIYYIFFLLFFFFCGCKNISKFKKFLYMHSFFMIHPLPHPSLRQRSWCACLRWVWPSTTSTSRPTPRWPCAPTPCSGCRAAATRPGLGTPSRCARSCPTLRPFTSAVSLWLWASLEALVYWRYARSHLHFSYVSLKIT